jgi:hypothetical protein
MDLEQISQKKDEKQKQLQKLLENKAAVDEEYGKVSLEIARLEVRKRELGIARTKAASIIAIVKVEIQSLTDNFFNKKAQ